MPEGDLKERLGECWSDNLVVDVPTDPETKVEPEPDIKPMEFKLCDLEVGKEDPRGRVVRDILWAVDAFKIYKTDGGISPFFSDTAAVAAKQRLAYLELGAGIAEFNHLIHTLTLRHKRPRGNSGELMSRDKNSLLHYEREMARCVAQAMFGNLDDAKTSLSALRNRLAAKISNHGRVVHLLINIVLVAIAIAGGLIFAKSGYVSVFSFDVKEMGLAVMMGSVGALFSTISRLQQMEVDPTITHHMHWVYGAQRVLVGALGGMVLYFGIKSGIVSALFAPLEKATSVTIPAQGPAPGLDSYWLSFVCMLAGFSERLVPNLLDAKSRELTGENSV
ncbi:MAG: hypothetical protein ABJ327_08885 [Litoreibacter sp.]